MDQKAVHLVGEQPRMHPCTIDQGHLANWDPRTGDQALGLMMCCLEQMGKRLFPGPRLQSWLAAHSCSPAHKGHTSSGLQDTCNDHQERLENASGSRARGLGREPCGQDPWVPSGGWRLCADCSLLPLQTLNL